MNITDVWGHGEEGVVCPGCGSRDVACDVDAMDAGPTVADCRTCGNSWLASWADPQCGECREFLPDGAEDDSLCETCRGYLETDEELSYHSNHPAGAPSPADETEVER